MLSLLTGFYIYPIIDYPYTGRSPPYGIFFFLREYYGSLVLFILVLVLSKHLELQKLRQQFLLKRSLLLNILPKLSFCRSVLGEN